MIGEILFGGILSGFRGRLRRALARVEPAHAVRADGARLRCAWCGAWIRSPVAAKRGVPVRRPTAVGHAVSHGLCGTCRDQLVAGASSLPAPLAHR